MNTVTYRYAKALFNLSSSDQQMIQWEQELQLLVAIVKKNLSFKLFLINPQITSAEKKTVLHNINIAPELIHFLLLVIEKGKFKYLDAIAKSYYQLVSVHCNTLEATLITAQPVDISLKKRLQERLTELFGRTIKLIEKIDPHVIGGGILFVGHHILDFSLKGRLHNLKRKLMKEGYGAQT